METGMKLIRIGSVLVGVSLGLLIAGTILLSIANMIV